MTDILGIITGDHEKIEGNYYWDFERMESDGKMKAYKGIKTRKSTSGLNVDMKGDSAAFELWLYEFHDEN